MTTPTPTVSLPIDLRPDRAWTGKRFVNSHQAHAGPFSGYGSTAAKAKAELVANLTAFLEGWSAPELIHYGGWSTLVHAEPRGTTDGILWVTQLVGPKGPQGSTSMMSGTKADAVRSARYRIVDAVIAADYFDRGTIEAAAEWLGENDGHGAHDLLRYAAWQRAAEYGKAAGTPDVHGYACENEAAYVDVWERPATLEGVR